VATNKDELITHHKARINKTRVFLQPGLDYTLLMRKHFGMFAAKMKSRTGFMLHHGIGADKEVVWGAIWNELTEVGSNGFDVDYSNYDGTTQPMAFDFFLEITDHYYGPVNRKVRHALIHCLSQSEVIVGDYLCETSQGNNSGNPLTDIFNSMTNVWFIYCSYMIARDVRGLDITMKEFDDNVRFLTYGDDVILAASDETLEYFNRVTVFETAALIGMKVTAANKSALINPYEDLECLTFLKSPFEKRAGYMAAPLPLTVIHRELMWEKKVNEGDVTIAKQRIDQAMGMIAHHGQLAVMELTKELKDNNIVVDFNYRLWEAEMRDKQEFARIEVVYDQDPINMDDYYLETRLIDSDSEDEWAPMEEE